MCSQLICVLHSLPLGYISIRHRQMDFLEELKWRGMLFDMTPGAEEILKSKSCKGYIGFDPTAPSMTIGNYVQVMLLTLWQRSGHHPIVLMGGATGRVGDPSGKDQERQLKSYEELDSNLAFQVKQMEALLDFEGEQAAQIINNYDFYREMNILTFLRDVGKTLTVNYMTSKDSVKNRLETGLSFTEFSYQLLQAYDFQCLYSDHDCIFQMGGSDQWGNITSGTEFIRRNVQGKAYAITTPLLTKSDGKKFGKSEKGNLWLDPNLTSAYEFYQFWLNADDADVEKFIKYFSLKSRSEMEAMITMISDNPNQVKRDLAKELTTRIHGESAYTAAQNVSELLFNHRASVEHLNSLTIADFEIIGNEIPSFEINTIGKSLLDLLTDETQIFSSKSEARRALKGNSIGINKVKTTDEAYTLSAAELIHGKYTLVESGKKKKYLIVSQG